MAAGGREAEGYKGNGKHDGWLFIVVRATFIYHVCNHFSLGFVAGRMLLAADSVADSVSVAVGFEYGLRYGFSFCFAVSLSDCWLCHCRMAFA